MDHIYQVFKPESTFNEVWLRSSKFRVNLTVLDLHDPYLTMKCISKLGRIPQWLVMVTS